MLVVRRKQGQWVEITHRSGDILRIRVYNVRGPVLDMAFDDDERNFDIQRPERQVRSLAVTE